MSPKQPRNPFLTSRQGHYPAFGAQRLRELSLPANAEQEASAAAERPLDGKSAPDLARTIDCPVSADVPPNTTLALILRYVADPGALTVFTHYAVYNDGTLAVNHEFRPVVDGMRVYPRHGSPMSAPPFQIQLGLAPDLSDIALVPGMLILQPGQVYEWFVTNRSAVVVTMGVRIKGYIDAAKKSRGAVIGG